MEGSVPLACGAASFREVSGFSMLPLLRDGSTVVYRPARLTDALLGAVVVCEHPFKPVLLVKRVDGVSDDGQLVLGGISPSESTDSRTFGPVPTSKLRGVVVAFWES